MRSGRRDQQAGLAVPTRPLRFLVPSRPRFSLLTNRIHAVVPPARDLGWKPYIVENGRQDRPIGIAVEERA
jgi:hypothetical protein